VIRALAFAATVGAIAGVAVPYRVQLAIEKSHPVLAYAPRRLPHGYQYAKYLDGRHGFDLWFNNSARAPDDLGYDAVKAACRTAGHSMHTFRANGVLVFWSATYEDQRAWRCLTRAGTTVILTASRSVSGDDMLNSPSRRRDALDLVRLVAFSERLG